MNATAPRFRSRRLPRLRVVEAEVAPLGSAALVPVMGLHYAVRVFTFAQYDRLAKCEKPKESYILPGIGFVAVDFPHGDHEAEDIVDCSRQALAQWRAERGLD